MKKYYRDNRCRLIILFDCRLECEYNKVRLFCKVDGLDLIDEYLNDYDE